MSIFQNHATETKPTLKVIEDIGNISTIPTVDIPFSKLHTTGKELEYMAQAINSGHIFGDGNYTKKCQAWLKETLGAKKVLLTHSCTAALEIAALLADIQPSDEIIMPSYTFVSTANAFVLRGGIPVFVDVRPDTLNLDEAKIEAAITDKTKAIVPVHYAGVGCEMDAINRIANQYGLVVIEDAAQAFAADYKNFPLGSLGHLGAFSFHATKNIVSGEGGALVINSPEFLERAEIIWEKGTNRSQFLRGDVDKYTWVDIGSSFLPSDLLAAFLWAQLESSRSITDRRLAIWNLYHRAFEYSEIQGKVKRPVVPSYCKHNAHIYYLQVEDLAARTDMLSFLKKQGIKATFHYVPLHAAPAGKKYGKVVGDLSVTEAISDRIIRLPLSAALTFEEVDYIITQVLQILNR